MVATAMGFAIAARAAGALDGALAAGLPAGPKGVGGEAVGDAMVVVGDGDGDVAGGGGCRCRDRGKCWG